MASLIIRLLGLAVMILIPGGFLLLAAYYAYRARHPRAGKLDFEGEQRRAPRLRARPNAQALRQTLRGLRRGAGRRDALRLRGRAPLAS
jgi:hypothetical protein